MTKQDPSANRIVLRPRFFDRECVFLLVVPCLGAAMLTVMALLARPMSETVHCDRASASCTYFFPGMFNGNTYTNPLAEWKSSKLITRKSGEKAWKVERTSTPLWLGWDSSDPSTVALFQKYAGELQTFLETPSQPTFDVAFPKEPIQRWRVIYIIAFGTFLGWFGFRWWRGWYSTLTLDPAARTITIYRKPMFFIGPRTVTRAASELRLVENVEDRYIGRGNRAKFALFELRDKATNKRVFKYVTLYDRKSRAQIDGDMALLARFVA